MSIHTLTPVWLRHPHIFKNIISNISKLEALGARNKLYTSFFFSLTVMEKEIEIDLETILQKCGSLVFMSFLVFILVDS